MFLAIRIRPHALAVALALFFAADVADAQCVISGGSSLCNGSVELCGPDGLYEWVWTDPAGNMSFDRCLIATQPGVYSLQMYDMSGGSFVCTRTIEGPNPPPCTISGPTSACEGTTVELCGPQGDFAWAWSGPSGFSGSTACVQVSVGGTYRLAVRRTTDDCPESACEHTVTFAACEPPPPPPAAPENCPRPAWFWMRQCLSAEPSAMRIDPALLAQLAALVDGGAVAFSWQDERAGFCATLHPRPATLRARAKRQFAAVHANVCAGEMGLPPVGGYTIALDRATRIGMPDGSSTVGEWLTWADGRLTQLESLDRGAPAVRETYRSIIRTGWRINRGHGIGRVCGRDAPDWDPDDDSATIAGDLEEPLNVELADDVDDRPEIARAMPNPFSAMTTVTYVVGGSGTQDVAIGVYDLAGRMVRELASGPQVPGIHEVRWDGLGADGARVRSGVYFVRGLIGAQRIAGQLTVLR